ncbi:hypothetical protein [Rickettsia japonica]|uniref:hypothetical protein n=2 Tax=spotted fever group TaxID=114277 RepID=UPI0002F043F9|nr:hypothetical protein [Rickettsia japonica]QHE24632.1 hypothetical protein GRX81_02100 [Rickettsia japonica]
MKKANSKLEEALYSMEEGILNLRKQKARLEKIFTFLQDLSTATDKIISLDI